MNAATEWTAWTPPYDPRQVDGSTVMEDEHGRLIETADCGQRCPGCGVCCNGYRDRIAADFGQEEFEGNLQLVPGSLAELEGGQLYRVASCGESCPGYGRCCPPFGQRERPATVAQARQVLLESEESWRWQMQEALLILAHEGSDEAVRVLEAYMPRAHIRLQGFAECALDEGRFFASVPRNAAQAERMMKQEVLRAWQDRAAEAYGKLEELEPELKARQYELEIAQRLLAKAQDAAARETWQTQVDVLTMLVQQTEDRLAEEQTEQALCEAVVAEIEADLDETGTASEAESIGNDPTRVAF
jgi:hypothetical protein